jgi:hypothetical protein
LQNASSSGNPSKAFRSWLAQEIARRIDKADCDDPECRHVKEQLERADAPLPSEIKIISVPVCPAATSRVYLVRIGLRYFCGATGNCAIELVEEKNGSFRTAAETDGNGVHFRPNSHGPYPDIFISTHMSALELAVGGYANAGGEWGQLYCGEIVAEESGAQHSEITICR